ncbi:MAG: stage III sporulation protein AE [Clostridia bacterium]|nr:stage III sporulation protein AE [Clostridia bacterium]
MKKYLLAVVLILLFCGITCSSVVTVFADNEQHTQGDENSVSETIEQLLDGIDLSELERFYNEYISSGNLLELIKKNLNGQAIDYYELFNEGLQLLKTNFLSYLSMFTSIIGIIIIGGLLSTISPQTFNTGEIVHSVCYLSIALIIFAEVSSVLNEVGKTIESINKQTQTAFPLLITLVSISGATSSAEIYKPTCVFLSGGIMNIISSFLFPLLTAICVLTIVSNLSKKFSLTKLVSLGYDIFKWVMGGSVAIFSIFTALNAITASVSDGVSLKALKYAVGSSVPIIGGFAKEGIDVFLAAGLLIKNSVGGVFLFILFFALLTPLIKVIVLSLTLKFLSAIAQPITDVRISDLISGLSKLVSYLSAVMITVFILYAVIIILLICTQSAVII